MQDKLALDVSARWGRRELPMRKACAKKAPLVSPLPPAETTHRVVRAAAMSRSSAKSKNWACAVWVPMRKACAERAPLASPLPHAETTHRGGPPCDHRDPVCVPGDVLRDELAVIVRVSKGTDRTAKEPNHPGLAGMFGVPGPRAA